MWIFSEALPQAYFETDYNFFSSTISLSTGKLHAIILGVVSTRALDRRGITKARLGMADETISGVVKWFNNVKGFGFITVEGREKDVFVHYSAITGSGYKSLNEGDKVTFNIALGQKGEEARNVAKA